MSEGRIATAFGHAGMEAMLPSQLHPTAAHHHPRHYEFALQGLQLSQLEPQPVRLVAAKASAAGGRSGGVLRGERTGIGELVQPGCEAIGVATAALEACFATAV